MTRTRFNDFNLSTPILDSIEQLGYTTPTEVQQSVIPVVLSGKDVIVKSRTGSGKTASFAIPLCELVEWEENKPQVLVLTPTRELALQVKEDIMNIGRYKRIKATAVFGKQPFRGQVTELKQKTHVVVGTPGRVRDHIERGTLSLEKIRYVVLDEADEMLNMGFLDQVDAILSELPKDRMTLLFSATFPEDIEQLSDRYMEAPKRIEAGETVVSTITHSYIPVTDKTKFAILKDVLVAENPDRCMIFCRTKEHVDFVANGLRAHDYPVEAIHGGMEQNDRLDAMKAFRAGKFRILVATDVAARGIDIENITHVIQYDLPVERESYVHRTGRTGRAGAAGQAISLVTPADERRLKEIEQYHGKLTRRQAPTEKDLMRTADAFEEKMATEDTRSSKTEQLDADIMKLFFNGGKKKKLRAVDFVGTIAKIEGVTADDIGIISIQDTLTYVDILNGKGPLVLRAMKTTKVKGKQLKVYEAFKK